MHRPFAAVRDGVRLAVRLTPKASDDRILGVVAEAAGGVALRVVVRAAPEAGKANEALLALLARHLRLPRRDLSLALGETSRRKLVAIAGDPEVLSAQLEEAFRPWLTRA